MGKDQIIIGSILIIAGILLINLTKGVVGSIILILAGICFIIFNKEEETIERRKDLK